jgi:hypothetical protein
MKCWLHEKKQAKPTRKHDMVLITGDARCLVDDLNKFSSLGHYPRDVYCIGRSYRHFLQLDHWGMVDGEENCWWAENLPDLWRNGKQRHTLGEIRGFDFDWDSDQPNFDDRGDKWWGSSALFAVLTSLAMGYSRIVLAGCPLDNGGHWYELENEITPVFWDEGDFDAWRLFKKQEESKLVKSLSGFTKLLLGRPSKKWLRGE